MWDALKWFFGSKARLAALVAVLYAVATPIAAHFDISIGQEQISAVVGALAAYVIGRESGAELPPAE